MAEIAPIYMKVDVDAEKLEELKNAIDDFNESIARVNVAVDRTARAMRAMQDAFVVQRADG